MALWEGMAPGILRRQRRDRRGETEPQGPHVSFLQRRDGPMIQSPARLSAFLVTLVLLQLGSLNWRIFGVWGA